MRWIPICLAIAVSISAVSCQRTPSGSQDHHVQTIAWREGDVDDALAEAKESGKPVLLYWGAKWCPPCNQLKTTLFKDDAFITETRRFVPVYLDGDTAGAQRWGERFGIRGYPTVIVLRADGSEITRLSTAAQLPEVLRVAAGRTTSIDTLFDQAEKNPSILTPDEWQLLAAYDWQNDPKRFNDKAIAAALLEHLAITAPEGPLKRRFTLLGLALSGQKTANGQMNLGATQQAQIEAVLPAILAVPEEVRVNRQELSFQVPSLIASLPDATERTTLGVSLIKGLEQVYDDKSLPLSDRLSVTNADIVLAKVGGKPISKDVLAKVRERVTWADQNAKEPMVRQSVISNAADLLHDAGDNIGARKLLEGELKRSAEPYYYMMELASLAEDTKDGPGAINWARKAYEASEGPATRIQWAIEYSKTVIRQSPNDKTVVEASAQKVLDELDAGSSSYYQRTRVKVASWGQLLHEWSSSHGGASVLTRVGARMATVCAKQGEEAESCRQWGQAS